MKVFAVVFGAIMWMIMVSSCQSSQHADEIRQIDSLLVVHQETASLLNQVDSLHAKASRDTFARNWSGIRAVIEANPDVIEVKNDPWWNYATLYEANDRGVKKLLRRYFRLLENHRLNEAQLTAFRSSVKNDQIPSDSIPLYLISEKEAVNRVQHETSLVVPELMRTLEVLDSLHAFAGEASAHYHEILSVKTK